MIWRRKRRPSPEAVRAREQAAAARQDLAAARADDDQVDQVARRLRELRRKNHYTPLGRGHDPKQDLR
ncbi:DUF7620 family protein [Micromonospora sonchi]|uniref:DUF7620 family protein n=1 Tax=Micromonospora sonchi TaxID=1763543 RepID=UPI00402B940F